MPMKPYGKINSVPNDRQPTIVMIVGFFWLTQMSDTNKTRHLIKQKSLMLFDGGDRYDCI